MAEVLPAQTPDDQSYFAPSPLRRSPASTTLLASSSYSSGRRTHLSERSNKLSGSFSSSAPSSPVTSRFDLSDGSSTLSTDSTPTSSLSFDTDFDDDTEDDDDTISFPSYSRSIQHIEDCKEDQPASPRSQSPPDEQGASSPEILPVVDDTAIRPEPTQHVDYLSYDWKEEDIWSSWKHIVSKRRLYGERSRLENASWRTWAKSKNHLKTVSPETLNWLKDHDVTWLYGPLQTSSQHSSSHQTSESASRLSKSNSFVNKKPILKKRSASEVMLQKSISASSLLKQAAASVQAQQESKANSILRRRPIVGRAASDFVTSSIPSRTISRDTAYSLSSHTTSGLQTPDGEKKHIRFDDKVEQCIAVECKDGDDYDEQDEWAVNDDSSDDEGVVMMKTPRRKPISRTSSKGNFSLENKTIAKLPSTTLKYRTDSPDIPDRTPTHSLGYYHRSSKLSPSPSQETLRPSNPSTNFLLGEGDDDDDDDDISWEPSGAFTDRHDSLETSGESSSKSGQTPEESGGLRRTESGMFMPYEDDDEEASPPGLLGRVVDTVNTARDIAHVIWNVGWRK